MRGHVSIFWCIGLHRVTGKDKASRPLWVVIDVHNNVYIYIYVYTRVVYVIIYFINGSTGNVILIWKQRGENLETLRVCSIIL